MGESQRVVATLRRVLKVKEPGRQSLALVESHSRLYCVNWPHLFICGLVKAALYLVPYCEFFLLPRTCATAH